MKAWMRVLKVVLTSKKLNKRFEFEEPLSISVSGHKYMSTLKDTFTVKIDNLTYNEVTQIVMGQFYDVEIQCGYQKGNVNTIFSGGVLYITNKLNANKTNTIIILCTSKLVASYGQSRLNLTLNSGINLYSAINFICKRAGIPNSNVSTQFKKQFLTEVMTINDTPGTWIDKLCAKNTNFISSSDSITDQTFSIFDAAKSNARVIKLDANNIVLTGGYPRLTSDGLELTILPTFNFMCGDVIKIDNSIVDISVNSRDEISQNYAAYFSQKGEYMIYEMNYTLQNRGQAFTLTLNCKNRDRISAYAGK